MAGSSPLVDTSVTVTGSRRESIAVVIITDNNITCKDECFKVKSELADCEGTFTHLQRTGGPAA